MVTPSQIAATEIASPKKTESNIPREVEDTTYCISSDIIHCDVVKSVCSVELNIVLLGLPQRASY